MPSFKSDTEFLTFISMGAAGVRRVMENLQKQGRMPLLLERGSNDFKLWKQLRIKAFRVPDILCVDTGRRVEARAKTSFEISGSHSMTKPERAWDYGLHDTDYITIPVCRKSGARPIDWEAIELVQYVAIGDMRRARDQKLTNLTDPKGAQQGSEVRLIWPSSVASSAGEVLDVGPQRLQFRSATSGRVISLALEKGGKPLTPRVEVGESVMPCQVLSSVVPVYRVIADEPRVDAAHYLKDFASPSASSRFAAAKALSLFAGEAVEHALVRHLQLTEEHIFTRLEVAASLTRRGNSDGWNFLEAALADEFLSHRVEAVIVLAEVDEIRARKLLATVLLDRAQDVEVRAGAAWALGEHKQVEALDILMRVFAEESRSIRVEAARALAKIAPSARKDMLEAFGTALEIQRPAVAWAVSKTGGADFGELLPLLKSDDARQWAAFVLGTQDPQRYVGQIEEMKLADPQLYFAVTVLWKILASWVFDLEEFGV